MAWGAINHGGQLRHRGPKRWENTGLNKDSCLNLWSTTVQDRTESTAVQAAVTGSCSALKFTSYSGWLGFPLTVFTMAHAQRIGACFRLPSEELPLHWRSVPARASCYSFLWLCSSLRHKAQYVMAACLLTLQTHLHPSPIHIKPMK